MSRRAMSHRSTSHQPFGQLLAEARRQRGYSQVVLATLLCAAAGTTTVTRHEVSRWERGERLPGAHWLGWLALVLDLPVARLRSAARSGRPAAASVSDAAALCRLAQRWLREEGTAPGSERGTAPSREGGSAAGVEVPAAQAIVIADLRRMDDLIGGADLAPTALRQWRAACAELAAAAGADRRHLLQPAAELAQLAGWTAADAGDCATALHAYGSGVALTMESGDLLLGAHLLGSASHLLADSDPRAARHLAELAAAGVRARGSAGLRALLAQRAAFAAARCGDVRAAQECLVVAGRLAERLAPAAEPSWLYWLDARELAAMTGRCLVALDRPLRALTLLLEHHTTSRAQGDGAGSADAHQPRTAAVYSGWLARALLSVGELEQACVIGTTSVLETVRSGSVRAARQTRTLGVRLATQPDTIVTRELSELIRHVTGYLPVAATTARVD